MSRESMLRRICGTNSPTKPILPATATHIAQSGIITRMTFFFNPAASMPREMAASSPRERRLTLPLSSRKLPIQTSVTIPKPMTAPQSACRKPPAIQKASSCERFCISALREAADRKKMLKAPVILVINAKAMATSAAAMVLGYKMLDKNVNIAGVITNNVKSESHYNILKEAIETYTGVEVLGYFPPNKEFSLESRHLGLIPSVEMDSLKAKFDNLAEEIEKYINIDRIIEIAESEEIESSFDLNEFIDKNKVEDKTIAVAYDKAFNFYYRENLELFEKLGMKIKYFSPIKDKKLPSCDYVYIGGGFPEIFAKELHDNKEIREEIFKAYEKNIPIYAECGGLMYLGEKLQDKENNIYDMVGVFQGCSKMTSSLKRFGYCLGEAKVDTILAKKNQIIKGHEFHHSIFESNEECAYHMRKVKDNKVIDEWEGGYSKKNTLATYLHTHFYNNLDCIANFIKRGCE